MYFKLSWTSSQTALPQWFPTRRCPPLHWLWFYWLSPHWHMEKPSTWDQHQLTHPAPHTPATPEYAQDLEQYLNHSSDFGKHFNKVYLTLQFLPGSHPVDILIITSIHRLEILGNSSAVAQVSVVCNANTGLTFSNISEVRIDGLAFVSCGRSHVVRARSIHHASCYGYNYFITYYGLHLQSVQTAEIIDCTFQDSYGSALG